MEEQDKKTTNRPSPEEIAKALEALKGTPLPTDIEPIRVYVPPHPDRFGKRPSNEEIAKALESPLPTDTEMFKGDLSKCPRDLFKETQS